MLLSLARRISLKNALVTGSAGFIGSHICELLLSEGFTVRGIDSLVVGRQSNMDSFKDHPQFSFHQVDITDRSALDEVMKGVEAVFHLAGLADIVPSIENPEAYYHNNVFGTFCVLESARSNNIKRFVYAASSSCYGIPGAYPTPETMAIQPEYPYALTKYLGEEMVLHWGLVYNLPVISLRLYNVYGPRSRTTGAYGAVFGVFLAQKLAGKPFTVVGDGNQTRDFTFVTDVASAFLKAAQSDVCGKVFNVGSGGTYTINKLVELLGGDIVYIPKRPGEPDCTFADIRKIKEELGWEPKVSFEDGVNRMLGRIKDWSDAPVWDTDSIAKATESWFKYLGDNA